MGRCTPQDEPLICSSTDQAKGAPARSAVWLRFGQQQLRLSSVEARMGRCTPQDEPLVCSSTDQAKGAFPCKVGGLVEIQTAATQTFESEISNECRGSHGALHPAR
jgi:hypothetical protein